MKTILFTLSLFLSSNFFSQKYEIYVYDISSRLCESEVSKEFCMIQPDTVENYEDLNMKYILDFDSGQMTFYEFLDERPFFTDTMTVVSFGENKWKCFRLHKSGSVIEEFEFETTEFNQSVNRFITSETFTMVDVFTSFKIEKTE
jgi:hypothetical protein